MAKALRLRVTGRVQGVGYRAWAVREARALGLAGWVRNREDGSVEALIAGPEEAVSRFIAAAQDGPPAARVAALDCEPSAEEASSPFTERSSL